MRDVTVVGLPFNCSATAVRLRRPFSCRLAILWLPCTCYRRVSASHLPCNSHVTAVCGPCDFHVTVLQLPCNCADAHGGSAHDRQPESRARHGADQQGAWVGGCMCVRVCDHVCVRVNVRRRKTHRAFCHAVHQLPCSDPLPLPISHWYQLTCPAGPSVTLVHIATSVRFLPHFLYHPLPSTGLQRS